ncbi:MAG TPA: hypothetical protein VMR41_02770 [Patescibacteria group bacterium]|nr:hypothetical protein [Patescibacteria group bacterium]
MSLEVANRPTINSDSNAVRLAERVVEAYERQEEDVYLLPKTGFNVRDQVQQLKRDFIQGKLQGENTADIVDGWLQKTSQDIQGFKVEYLCEGPLFPIVLDYANVDGKKRVVAPLYNGKLLVDTVSPKERKGSVARSVKEVENFLLEAAVGRMAVMTSPDGWSGLTDPQGNKIKYPDAQTYVWQKQEDGSIRGFTVKTDMTLKQNEELLEQLGISKEQLGYRLQDGEWKDQLGIEDRLSTIVESVAYLRPGASIEDIVARIKQIKKSEVAFTDTKGESRTFTEIFQTLKNPQNLWTLDEQTQKLVETFNIYVQRQLRSGYITEEVMENIETALGMTILDLAGRINPSVQTQKLNSAPPQMILSMVQAIGGCNGGGIDSANSGNSGNVIVNGITPRNGEVCVEIRCRRPGCGWKASESDAKEIAEGKLKSCPKEVRDANGKVVLDKNGKPKLCEWKP